jgi:hypothetical protein
MNRKKIWPGAFLIAATLCLVSCAQAPPLTTIHTTTPPPPPSPTTTVTTITTPPPPPPPTTLTTTTPKTTVPASSVLTVPGQQFRGAIQTRGGGTYYSLDKGPFYAQGGAPQSTYTWSVASASTLPPGTTFDPQTGMFYAGGAGIALVPGTQTFKMTASDGSRTATGTFSLVVATGDILPVADFQKSLASDIKLPDVATGQGYGVSLWAMGDGGLPWLWSVRSGSLPPGLGINPASGVVYGTPLPSAAGNTYKFTISVKEALGKEAIGEPTYSIFVPK